MNDSASTNSSSAIPRPPLEKTLVSVVLPVLNEAESLPVLSARIAEVLIDCGVQYEIIFVDDGSRDDSPRVLDQLASASRRVRVLHLSRNFGHQAAVHAGLANARGDAVVLMDSDMQDDPVALPQFLREWEAGYDVVYGVRTHPKEHRLHRLFLAGFSRLMSRIASAPIPADAGTFGLVDRRVARQILALGESDRYFPGLRSWVGFRQKGVEIERQARCGNHRRASYRDLFRLAKTVAFSFSAFPLLIFNILGVAASLVFIGLGGFALYCKMFTDLAIPGWTSYIVTASFFGAINAIGISILGEYVVRIYDQVRGRPQYVIDRTVNMEAEEPQTRINSMAALSAAMDLDNVWCDADYRDLLNEAAELLQEDVAPDNRVHGDAGKDAGEDEEERLLAFPMREGY